MTYFKISLKKALIFFFQHGNLYACLSGGKKRLKNDMYKLVMIEYCTKKPNTKQKLVAVTFTLSLICTQNCALNKDP